jgi:toxin ParE1/3/4
VTTRKRPTKPEVWLTNRALADLHEIERYSVREWGRKTANRYLDEVEAALNRLRENPEILRLEPDFAAGLHFYRVRKHVLVCDRRASTITVLTILHTSMDISARLAELEPQLSAEARFLEEIWNHVNIRRGTFQETLMPG